MPRSPRSAAPVAVAALVLEAEDEVRDHRARVVPGRSPQAAQRHLHHALDHAAGEALDRVSVSLAEMRELSREGVVHGPFGHLTERRLESTRHRRQLAVDEPPAQDLELVLEERLAAEAARMRPVVQAVSDEHSNRRRDLLVQNSLYHSGHAAAVTGWILERDGVTLQDLLARRMPSAQAYLRPPRKTESPPVKLENPRILKPFQMLLDMFGLPPYFGYSARITRKPSFISGSR